jgi:hypothetical protein
VLLSLLSACGGGSSHRAATPAPTAPADAVSSGPRHLDLLMASSDAATNATTFHATFTADVLVGTKHVTEDGTMDFKAPGQLHMTMNVMGQQMEFLLLMPDMYLSIPGKGWYSLGDSVINRQAYQQYAQNRGLIDYTGLVKQLDGVKQLPDDAIDGKSYSHFSGTFDMAKQIDKIPKDVFKPGVADLTKSALQPGALDAWVDPETNLPRRATMKMSMSIAGSDTTVDMTMDYETWNRPVEIPAAPADAKPWSQLTNGIDPQSATYLIEFCTVLTSFGEHLGSLPAMKKNDTEALHTLIAQVNDDLRRLDALDPPERFSLSYHKYHEAFDTFQTVLGMFENSSNGGQYDKAGADRLSQRVIDLLDEGSALFEAETKSPN